MAKDKKNEVTAYRMDQKPELRISLPPDHKLVSAMGKVKPNAKVTIEAEGRVKAFNHGSYDSGLTLEITGLEIDRGMAGDLDDLKKARRG